MSKKDTTPPPTTRTRSRTPTPAISSDSELGKNIAAMTKRMGEGVATMGMSNISTTFVETGVFLLDYGLLGGLAESRMSMLYGHPGAGKTTMAIRVAASAQRKHPNMTVAYIDVEGTMDRVWAERAGIDPERFAYLQPETGEQAVDILEAVMRSKEVCCVVLDSIPALVPQKVIERSAEDPTMAVRAALIGVACSKMLSAFSAERQRGHNPSVIMINQWRSKVGFVMGNPNTLPGGNQPRYAASAMVEIKKRKEEMGKDRFDNDTTIYNEHAFDIDKSKGGSSVRQGEFRLVTSDDYACLDAPSVKLPAGTVDDYKVVATYAKRMGFITGGGQSWKIDEVETKFNKIETMIMFMVENPQEFTKLKRKMIALKRKENGLPALPPDGYLLGHTKGKR